MTRTELHKEWEERIAQFRASDESAPAWCTAHAINLHQFRYWLRRFPLKRSAMSSPSTKWLLSVQLDEQSDPDGSSLVVRVGCAVIEGKPGYNPVLLTEVVRTLATLC